MVADYHASGATTTHGIAFYDSGSYLSARINLQNLTLFPYNNVTFRAMCYKKDPLTAQLSIPFRVTVKCGPGNPPITEPQDKSNYT